MSEVIILSIYLFIFISDHLPKATKPLIAVQCQLSICLPRLDWPKRITQYLRGDAVEVIKMLFTKLFRSIKGVAHMTFINCKVALHIHYKRWKVKASIDLRTVCKLKKKK